MTRWWKNGVQWIAGGIANPVERLGVAMRRLAADDHGPTARRKSARRHRAEADLERRRFELAVKGMPIGLCLFDPDKRLVICNQRYADMYGLPPSLTRAGTHWRELIQYWIDVDSHTLGMRRDFTDGFEAIGDLRHVAIKTVHLPGDRIYNIVHQPLDGGGWVATHEDVSEQRKAEREIIRLAGAAEVERQRLEAALANMPLGLTMYDADKRLITANRSYAELYRLPASLVRRGTTFRDILEYRVGVGKYPGGDAGTWVERVIGIGDRQEPRSDVSTFQDGSTMRIVHQPTADGGWVSIHEDVTERYGAQQEIARLGQEAEIERQRLDAALTNMPIGLTMFDADKRLITANRRYAELYGIPAELMKPGTPFRDFMDCRIRQGSFPRAGSEEWLERLYGIVDRGEATRDLAELGDGRIVSIAHEPMVGGGWLATHEDVTERHQAEQQIARLAEEAEVERRRLDATMTNMPIGVCMFDGDRRLISANSRYAEMYRVPANLLKPGVSVDDIVSQRMRTGTFSDPDSDKWIENVLSMVERGEEWRDLRHSDDGRIFGIIFKPLKDGGWVSTHEDVTERYETQQQIARLAAEAEVERQRLNAAVSNMPIGLVMFDAEKRLIVANPRYVEMYRMPPHLAAPGTPLDAILQQRTRAGEHGGPDVESYDRLIREMVDCGKPVSTILHFRDGRIFSLVFQPMRNGGWVATHEDVTDRQKAQAQIAHMAHHDHLTDLPNRILFLESLEDALMGETGGSGVAVLYLDIDHFNAVNDALGHPVGDKLLQAVAQRLSGLVRHGDTAARLGGDEFAIVQNASEQPKSARALAQRVIEELGAPYTIDGHRLETGVSIGIALAPTDGRDAADLLKNAGMALYRAKADGRGRYRFFEPGMDARMQARRKLELDLRKAVDGQEFELHYQPQIDLKSGNIRGFEALLRWHHPERGLIPPAEFIPAAEETGLILPIGEWVLKEASTTASKWPSAIKVAVNLSPVQFRSARLLQAVASALSAAGLAANRLELEVTESVLLADTDAILALLGQLHSLGVKVAMDDFGTGYSSLGYLQKFRFDKIKIDRSFVQRIGDDDNSLAIIRAIVGISNSMGIATTAEGVETRDQLDRVRMEGCTEVQGYLTGRPMTADMTMTLLRDGSTSARVAVALTGETIPSVPV